MQWRKSSHSYANGNCVETAAAEGTVLVRDSNSPYGTVLAFTPEQWRWFLTAVKAGRHDLTGER